MLVRVQDMWTVEEDDGYETRGGDNNPNPIIKSSCGGHIACCCCVPNILTKWICN